MISLITISCIAAAFAPVVSKRLQSDTIRAGSTDKLESNCSEQFGEDCKFCGDKCCYICDSDAKCKEDEYKSTCKCACIKCNVPKADGGYGDNCLECNGSSCTKCTAGKNGFYIKEDGTCAQCTVSTGGIYSDGKVCTPACAAPDGYFCDNQEIRACGDKYQYVCTSCNAEKCTGCRFAYYLASNNTCQRCHSSCSTCTNPNTCVSCGQNALLDTNGLCLSYMSKWVDKCINAAGNTYNSGQNLSSNARCTECAAGYYLNPNNNRQCLGCSTIANCVNCNNSGKCETCASGYYAATDGKCYTCGIANCSQCNSNGKCGSCNKGYHLADKSGTSCVADDGKFNCSDSNFMQIGNLCVTRKNMGDVPVLTIPSTIIKVDASNEVCYSLNDLCCWTGTTSGACDAQYYSSYSGCGRMVCNWEAANEICNKFKYGGKKWRLPRAEEVTSWYEYSIGRGENGLMLCDSSSGKGSNQCAYRGGCEINSEHACHPYILWLTNASGGHYSIRVEGGKWTKLSGYYYNMAFSTRCVTEMDD